MLHRASAAAFVGAALLVTPIGAANAGPGSTVVSRSGLPTPLVLTIGGVGCAGTGTTGTSSTSHVAGPGLPPAGTGSLAVSIGSRADAAVRENFADGTTLSELKAYSFQTYRPAASPLQLLAEIVTDADSDNNHYVVYVGLTAPGTPAWQATDVLGAGTELTWYKYSSTNTEISHSTDTWATFEGLRPTVPIDSIFLDASNCSQSAAVFNLDDLVIGANDTTTTYDFEPLLKPTIQARPLTTSLAAGKKFRPRATLTVAGTHPSGQTLELLAKPVTAGGFKQIGTAVTNANGVATATAQQPTINTAYRWQYAATADSTAAASKATTVHVASAVNLRIAKQRARSTTAGETQVHATGRINPRHKGTVITLWRRKGKHAVKLGHTTEASNGSYSIVKVLPRGRYALYVTAAKDAANSAGRSATRKVTIT